MDNLPSHDVPSYVELDLRLGWWPSDEVELSLVGRNLLHESHPEFTRFGKRQLPGNSIFTHWKHYQVRFKDKPLDCRDCHDLDDRGRHVGVRPQVFATVCTRCHQHRGQDRDANVQKGQYVAESQPVFGQPEDKAVGRDDDLPLPLTQGALGCGSSPLHLGQHIGCGRFYGVVLLVHLGKRPRGGSPREV